MTLHDCLLCRGPGRVIGKQLGLLRIVMNDTHTGCLTLNPAPEQWMCIHHIHCFVSLQQRSLAILQVKFIPLAWKTQFSYKTITTGRSKLISNIKYRRQTNQNRCWLREWRGRMWDRLGGWSLMAAPLWYKQEMWSECPSGPHGPQSPVCGDTRTKHQRTTVL